VDEARAVRQQSLGRYVWVTAVIMSLGWGLRGYIGGGPFGAMIPGAFVALLLCLYYGYGPKATAIAAAFGAVGVGFGGEMTYGQTIGLARESATMAWGLTGLALKGGVWGLLGGAVLGMGLAADRLDRRRLWVALACFLAAAFVGIAVINEPKLIYFSDPVNKPRDESWAGLLFGTIALLAYLAAKEKRVAPIALRFALYGLVGGVVGFGGGGLFMAYGPASGAPDWMPWWKFMEFTFGFLFGAALGLAGYHLRDTLRPDDAARERTGGTTAADYAVPVLLVAGVLVAWPLLGFLAASALDGAPFLAVLGPLGRVLLGYTGLGCVMIALSARSERIAWQVALTVTFLAAVIDLQEDLLGEGDLLVGAAIRWGFVAVMALLAVAYVVLWQRDPKRCLFRLTGVFLWALMAIALVKPFAHRAVLSPPAGAVAEAGGMAAYLFGRFEGMFIVHGIFLALAIISTLAIRNERRHAFHGRS